MTGVYAFAEPYKVKPITKKQFARMTNWQKGYVVYMCGARGDQPNVPESYEPSTRVGREMYEAGQFAAMIEAQDDG